jgi:hypothetical protein
VRIAFFSCHELIAGYYHAHRDLAAQDVDLVRGRPSSSAAP